MPHYLRKAACPDLTYLEHDSHDCQSVGVLQRLVQLLVLVVLADDVHLQRVAAGGERERWLHIRHCCSGRQCAFPAGSCGRRERGGYTYGTDVLADNVHLQRVAAGGERDGYIYGTDVLADNVYLQRVAAGGERGDYIYGTDVLADNVHLQRVAAGGERGGYTYGTDVLADNVHLQRVAAGGERGGYTYGTCCSGRQCASPAGSCRRREREVVTYTALMFWQTMCISSG